MSLDARLNTKKKYTTSSIVFVPFSKEGDPLPCAMWGTKKAVSSFRNKRTKKAESPCRKWGTKKNAG